MRSPGSCRRALVAPFLLAACARGPVAPAAAGLPEPGLFLMATAPPLGGTIVLECTARVCAQADLRVTVQAVPEHSVAAATVEVRLLDGAARECAFAFASPRLDLLQRQASTFELSRVVISTTGTRANCAVPFATTVIEATLLDGANQPLLQRRFDAVFRVAMPPTGP